MRIVFMGTPHFAVASLQQLVEDKHNIVAVVTTPDRQAGRGRKLISSAVKDYALSQSIDVLQPEKLRNPEWIEQLKSYNADLFVVVAFRMLPEMVWKIPRKGTINLHGSLLPQYRGAAPINWAIINGEKETGVSTFFINENIDTGAIIDQATMPIENDDTAGSLHDKMMVIGAKLLSETVSKIEKGNANSKVQNSEGAIKHAPKIFKDDTQIDFSQDVDEVYNFIRGLSPYPSAICSLKIEDQIHKLKIYKVSIISWDIEDIEAGTVVSDTRKYLHVACNNGFIGIEELQLAGKKKMTTTEFLNGFNMTDRAKML